MTDFYFYITEDAINDMEAADYEAFERAQDGDFKLYRVRPSIARFMVDQDNKPIPYAVALKQSEKMKMREVTKFVTAFFEAMQNKAIPKTSGTPSEQPSTVPTVESRSPVGSPP